MAHLLISSVDPMDATPYEWTPHGLPCYRSQAAPAFLCTETQLRGLGLAPGGAPCAYVDSQYGPAALYLVTEAQLAQPEKWPPSHPEAGS